MPWGPLPPVPLIGLSAAPSASVSPGKSEVYDTDASREGEREEREEEKRWRRHASQGAASAAAAPPPRNHAKRCPHGHGPIYIYLFSQTDRPIGRPACWSERQEAATFLA